MIFSDANKIDNTKIIRISSYCKHNIYKNMNMLNIYIYIYVNVLYNQLYSIK